MRKRKLKQGLAAVLVLFMTINYAGNYLGRSPAVSLADTATVTATSLNVRSGPGTASQVVGKLAYGSAVNVVGQTTGSDGKVWYQVQFGTNGSSAGYVRSDYVKFPVAWQSDGNFEQYLSSQGFPESYKPGLRQLHAEYPSWVFVAAHTNLDWNDVINNESIVGRNLVSGSSPTSWKSMEAGAYNWETNTWPSFDSGSWVAASREITSYYMDPRNFLNGKYVFQFLRHKYNSEIHTIDGIKSMVQGTFLDRDVNVSGYSPSSGSSSSGSFGPGTYGPGASGTGTSAQGGSLAGAGSGSNSSASSAAGPAGSGASSGQAAGGAGPGASSGSNRTVQPGVSPGSGGGGGVSGSSAPPGSSGTVNSGSNTKNSSGPDVSGSRPSVSLQSPSASVDRRDTVRVGASMAVGVTSGPGGSPAPSSGSSGGSASAVSYAQIIMDAAARSGVNPYVLTAMILQEQGSQGSRGISGTVAGYEGYYNFFNIEAYKSGSMEAIERGLWFASQSGSYERPWNSVDRAILGGAMYYGANYVDAGQDTFYLKKFNVQGSNLYKHQYMTNVQAAASEGAKLEAAYSSHLKQTALEFKIPVYQNMPEAACPQPNSDSSPNNRLSSLTVDGYGLTPTFSRDVTSYSVIVGPEVTSVNVRAAALDAGAAVTGTGTVQLQSGSTDIAIQVKAQNGAVSSYVIHVVRQGGGSSANPAGGADPGGTGGQSSGPGTSIQIITSGPEQSTNGLRGSAGPGGSNVTIIR